MPIGAPPRSSPAATVRHDPFIDGVDDAGKLRPVPQPSSVPPPVVLLREELECLIPVLERENAILAPDRRLEAANPLALHGRYLGVELSAAFDQRTKDGEFRDFYTGVEPVAGGRYDMLLVTLEKSAQQKEHLRYRDFPLSDRRLHWQSKAGTTRASKQGRRHLTPEVENCTPLLFVRELPDDRPGVTMAFRYLGPVRPDSDEGERPIRSSGCSWTAHAARPRSARADRVMSPAGVALASPPTGVAEDAA